MSQCMSSTSPQDFSISTKAAIVQAIHHPIINLLGEITVQPKSIKDPTPPFEGELTV